MTALLLVGLVVLALASALGIASAAAMSTKGAGTPLPSASANRLVVAGPYRSVRNPMALAGITQGVAVGLLLGLWMVVVYALAGSTVVELRRPAARGSRPRGPLRRRLPPLRRPGPVLGAAVADRRERRRVPVSVSSPRR
ncbi:methyltransferase [Sphingomonas sp. LR61]|uniref:methyltransferase n=1 Tax=Sphingomonas sp. LR61 TaxID=3050234 RepID=UPI002FE267BA